MPDLRKLYYAKALSEGIALMKGIFNPNTNNTTVDNLLPAFLNKTAINHAEYQADLSRAIQWAGGCAQTHTEPRYLHALISKVLMPGNYSKGYKPCSLSTEKLLSQLKPVPLNDENDEPRPVTFDSQIWSDFESGCKAIKAIKGLTIDSWIQAFETLLFKHGSLLPWPYCIVGDQNLNCGVRMTAALITGFISDANQRISEPKYRLWGADLSGIQQYLFDIQSKNAAKLLKGRSFYLYILVDAILRRILRDTGLQNGHIIYSTAGGFYLLAPDTKKINDAIDGIKKKVIEENYKLHREKLYVSLAFVVLDKKNINQLGEEFLKLSEALSLEKRQSNKDIFDQVFADSLTSEVEPDAEEDNNPGAYANNPIEQLYWEQIELGKKIHQSDKLFLYFDPTTVGKDSINPLNLGIVYKPIPRNEPNDIANSDFVLYFNQFPPEDQLGIAQAEWYAGNRYPADTHNNAPVTYDELAKSTTGQGISRLGILRMDVDNLGMVFMNGITKGIQTFTRYAQLSLSFDLFFKPILNTLYQKKYSKDIQIIYSGGDDLFVIGYWDSVLQFADEIRSAFNEYTGNNNKLTLSAGLSLVTGKYPIIRAAQFAGEQEEQAKLHDNGTKNAIGLMDYTLSWDYEWKELKEKIDSLREFICQSEDTAILKYISKYFSISQSENSSLRWRYLMAYDFSRMVKRKAGLESLVGEIKIYVESKPTKNPNFTNLMRLNLAARLVNIETRNLQ